MPITVSIKELLEAGVHFGHQTRRWNPKMKEFIFGERNGIYIIDLQKTHERLHEALQYVHDLAAQGKTLLFVGTKRQAQEAIVEEAERCGMPFVTERWLGGLLTNFVTIRRSLDRIKEIEMIVAQGRGDRMTKKELARLDKERAKLDKNLRGVRGMKTVPDAVFVIDTRREAIGVREARKLRIPVVGIVDTNCDPEKVDYVIPGNDDALRAIRLFARKMADAVLAGRGLRESKAAQPEPVAAAEAPAPAPAPAPGPAKLEAQPVTAAPPPA